MDKRIEKIDLTGALPEEGSKTNTRLGNTIGDLGTGAPGSSLNSDNAGTIGGGTVINPAAGLDGPNTKNLERAGGGMAGHVIGKADQYVSDGCDEYCEDETLEGNRTIKVDKPIPPGNAA